MLSFDICRSSEDSINNRVVHCVVGLLMIASAMSLLSAQNFVDVKPSPQRVEWQDLEFGVIIHFGL